MAHSDYFPCARVPTQYEQHRPTKLDVLLYGVFPNSWPRARAGAIFFAGSLFKCLRRSVAIVWAIGNQNIFPQWQERGAPFTTAGFARMIERAGVEAKLGFKAHPHMLRHACGFKLANDGHDTRSLQAYLGHKNIQHTVRYSELAPDRFKDFWRR